MPSNSYDTPAEPKKQLTAVKEGNEVDSTTQTKFRAGVGKLLHLM